MKSFKKYLFVFYFAGFFAFLPIFTLSAQTVKPIRILIVPGHDNEVWGAEYKGVKEADMSLALGIELYDILSKDKRFKVFITRDINGYTKEFSDYFKNHAEDITSFKNEAKKRMKLQISNGSFIQKPNVQHTSVKAPVALRLYGIDKWANENNIDAMIHIHFNDDGRNNKNKPGPYKGFSVYMPDVQLPSGNLSAPLAKSIFKEIIKRYDSATDPRKNGGVIPDQKLIAMGANETLLSSVRSVLIEYGFIYEKQFRTYSARKKSYDIMSKMTADGITNSFFPSHLKKK